VGGVGGHSERLVAVRAAGSVSIGRMFMDVLPTGPSKTEYNSIDFNVSMYEIGIESARRGLPCEERHISRAFCGSAAHLLFVTPK
jgi:hypothetical protein